MTIKDGFKFGLGFLSAQIVFILVTIAVIMVLLGIVQPKLPEPSISPPPQIEEIIP